ncbi:cytochrome c oxidase assembly protein COX16 homolog, mitochondrial isoform X2 [Varanus komodoensis]|uniref:cytochrome c oxidase assembly protein COX16 homolog, mitochondrial isoform X2 n=1 Tax=Varanus komodoensis TaxID=61221 RepID=UPI001CF78539|nr:cytochrome c oxidase assembly protein COX16 homolog, mitochondrial isoform X2 [Varanus komodoensis]
MRALRKNKTLQYGIPMMVLIIGGSFGLREFAQIRYDAHKLHSKVDPALEERIRNNKVTLESEYEGSRFTSHMMLPSDTCNSTWQTAVRRAILSA